jgi:hypothetical protein
MSILQLMARLGSRQLPRYSKSLPPIFHWRKTSRIRNLPAYGEGEVVVVVSVLVELLGDEVVLMVVLDSVLVEGAGDSFTMVVLFSVLFSAGGFVTVVSDFSQAPRSAAALTSTQIYFFIV